MALTEEGIISVPGFHSRWVRLANGAKAHYMTAGETGPPVVLLHGGIAGSSGTAGWRFMAPFLAANGFRVYAPDQPGFGLADAREEYWPKNGPASHIQFVEDFATALCLDQFHLAGNSMGCVNTVNYLMAHPYRVLSFALIAGYVGNLVPPGPPSPDRPNPLYFDGGEPEMRDMMESIIMNKAAITDDLVKMRVMTARRQKDSYVAWRDAFLHSYEGNLGAMLHTKDRLDKIDIPGIYLYGVDDVLIPVEEGYRQEEALPNIQFFYPEECGHQGQTDQPEMFAQAFMEFFRDGRVSRKTADWAGVSKRRPEIGNFVEQATATPAG